MNAKPNIDMLEATRLTREGRLAEAMAVLSGGLPSAIPHRLRATQARTQAASGETCCRTH